MTTAILREDEGRVVAAWDTQMTRGGFAQIALEDDKVFMSGGVLFAVAGMWKSALVLKYTKFTPIKPRQDEGEYVFKVLLPEIRGALLLAENGGDETTESDTDPLDVDLVVGVRGKLFSVSGLTGMHRTASGVYTVGSGGDFALGAVAAGASLRYAVELAAEYDVYTNAMVRVKTFTW